MERRLAAILAADVVAFSRLMGDNEETTLAQLKATRGLIDRLVAEHRGRVFGSAGDSVLAEFASPVEAVRCAVAIQQSVAAGNAGLAEERRMRFRIGINLGDVIVEGGNLHGEGVNIAARLETLAEPGGITIAGSVHDHIVGKEGLVFTDAGTRTLKNIARPIRMWRWTNETDTTVVSADAPLALPDKPSIAVLPFTNMSQDIEQEYFSDGITEDIITELSRYRELFVIARNSCFAFKGQSVKVQDVGRELGVGYVVEGSVRKAGNRMRITAQLVEAETGNHIWAERYDRDLEDIFDVQDEVTQAIVAVLPVRLHGAVLERATRKPVESLNAYEHLLRARWRWTQDATEIEPVIEELKVAIGLDPGYARAYAWLAHAHSQSIFSQGHSHAEEVRHARHYAEKALKADEQDAFVHAIAGLSYAICGDHMLAKSHSDRALALNPNEFFAIFVRGIVLNYAGNPGEAIDWLQKSRRLDPQAPDFYLEPVIECYYMLHAYEKSIETFKLWHDPPFYMYDVLAACHAQLGNMDEAKAAREHFERFMPADFVYAENLKAYLGMMAREGDRKHWLEGFRKAGMSVGDVTA